MDKEENSILEDIKEGFYRSFTPGTYVEEKNDKGEVVQRKVRAPFATDDPVEVYDWSSDSIIRECLRMDGMQLPANKQVPLLDNHNRWNGSVSVRGSCRNMEDMKNGTAEADVYFSSTAQDIYTLAREGHLTDLSVGYKTYADKTVWVEPGQRTNYGGKDYDNTNSSMRLAIRTMWTPFEVSTTPIGADARTKFRSANINHIKKGDQMDPVKDPAPAKVDAVNVDEIRKAALKEGREAERARIDEIGVICRELNLGDDFLAGLVKEEIGIDQARQKAVYAAQKKMSVVEPSSPNLRIGADEADKFREGVVTNMLVRNSYPVSKLDAKAVETAKASEFRNIDSPIKVARLCLERSGVKNTTYMDNYQVATEIMNSNSRASVAQGTGDFPYILAAAINKFLMKGYDEVPTTYDKWVGKQVLNDFKQNKLVNLSNFSDLDLVPEGENFKWGRFTDKGEYATLVKWGKAFVLSFESLVNDDKSAFSTIPARIGNAVNRMKERCVYNYLIRGNVQGTGSGVVGPTMNEDSKAMFHTDHANIGTTAAPSTASLSDARKLLRKIKLLAPDPTSKTQYTNAAIKYIITGTAKETEWEKVLGSPAAYGDASGVATQNSNANIINPFVNKGIELICTPYIDEVSETAWYFAADANVAQHIVMATLAGEEAPQLRSAPTEIGMARGIAWDLMSIFTVASSDWRGIGKNAGA